MRIGIIIACIALFVGCGGNKVPKGILPPDKIQEIFKDLMTTSEFLNMYIYPKSNDINKTEEQIRWMEKVFAIHKITKTDFEKSMEFYQQNPDILIPVFDSLAIKPQEVIDTLPATPLADTLLLKEKEAPIPDTPPPPPPPSVK